jgi:ABC-type iron transport system FetAB permease component
MGVVSIVGMTSAYFEPQGVVNITGMILNNLTCRWSISLE